MPEGLSYQECARSPLIYLDSHNLDEFRQKITYEVYGIACNPIIP